DGDPVIATKKGVNVLDRGSAVQEMPGVQELFDFPPAPKLNLYVHPDLRSDGDLVIPTKKGVNVLDRGSAVHEMAEVQELFDFPPAPKLNLYGKLDPAKASQSEIRGEALFFGKANGSI